MRLQKSNLKSSCLRLTLRPSDAIQFLQKKRSHRKVGLLRSQKRIGFTSLKIGTNAPCNFRKKKMCLQKNYFTLCTFNSNASSNFHKKMSYGWLGSLCSRKNIPLTSFMFDSYTLCYFYTKKTDHRGRWACCAHIKILHLPHLHCLSHDMQFSKKNRLYGHLGSMPLKEIFDSPYLHLILTNR